ncbi:hypothetical protein Tco_0027268 [Tanacetum coccineum]
MSDSEDSTVTYTAVSSPFGGFLDIGSPGVDGPPVMLEDPYAYVVAAFQAPPSPDYVPGLEYPPSPDFVLEPVYPCFIIATRGCVHPADYQPLPAALSPTADSPGYVPESDPEEDPEEDDDEDPKEDPADYPKLTKETMAIMRMTVALPAVDQAPSAEETEPFETDESAATPPPHPAYRVTARISIRDEPPTPFWSDTEVARLLAIPTPPPSPLSPWSSPLPQIPLLHHYPQYYHHYQYHHPYLIYPPPICRTYFLLGYRAPMIRLRAEAPSTSILMPFTTPITLSHTNRCSSSGTKNHLLLPIPLPTSSPPLHLLSINRRADRPEVTLPPQKRFRTSYTMVGLKADWAQLMAGTGQHAYRRQSAITKMPKAADHHRRQAQAMIDQGVTAALAARDANISTNGDDSHISGTGVRRTERTAREFENQVKFATCTLHSVALTWWNTHVKTFGHDAAYGTFPEESDKIEKYVGGLPDMIHGSVVTSKLKTMQDAVEIATELMDKKIRTFAERQTESKRKFEDTSRNTQNQQQQQ